MQRVRSRWLADTQAGLCYFLGVFAVAFCLGAVRTVAIETRVGATIAVLLETPIILVVSWWVSTLCIRRFDVGAAAADRVLTGAIAFTVLMLAEFTLSVALFDRSPADYAATFVSASGAIGLLAQIAFAAIPWLQSRVSDDRSPRA